MINSVDSIETVENLLSLYKRRNAVSNNYLLLDSYEELIHKKNLFYLEYSGNVLFLTRRSSHYQVFYYINDFEALFDFKIEFILTIEIVFRIESFKIRREIKYWEDSGFAKHLLRCNLTADFLDLRVPEPPTTKISIKNKCNEDDLEFVKYLMSANIDSFTGDQMTMSELKRVSEEGGILLAIYDNHRAGFLRYYVKNRIIWLGHLVVDPRYRGLGLAQSLIRDYVLRNKNGNDTRYGLWVIKDNLPAVRLYEKIGFKQAQRYTLSLLKYNK